MPGKWKTERKVYKADPLTLGLRSVIFLGYSLTLILSLVGFATYFYLTARQRGAIYGILRSLGLFHQTALCLPCFRTTRPDLVRIGIRYFPGD